MRNKTPLTLMEMLIMVAVFSVASALCLKAFLWADTSSAEGVAGQRAMIEAQNAAEAVKSCGGDYAKAAALLGGSLTGESGDRSGEADGLLVSFDREWKKAAGGSSAETGDGNAAYLLTVRSTERGEYLERAEVTVRAEGKEEPLASFEFAWQTEGDR